MKTSAVRLSIVLASAALLAATASAYALQPTGRATGYVPAVSDGDTFYIEIEGRRTRVRLSQIDSPESGQSFGKRAEQSLRELVWKKTVTVDWREIDRYGRPIVDVGIAGVNVNAEQVRRGMAWVYRRYATDHSLYALEETARQERRGLWVDPQPEMPWEWRKTNRRWRYETKAITH